jgi:hypothetical protein
MEIRMNLRALGSEQGLTFVRLPESKKLLPSPSAAGSSLLPV